MPTPIDPFSTEPGKAYCEIRMGVSEPYGSITAAVGFYWFSFDAIDALSFPIRTATLCVRSRRVQGNSTLAVPWRDEVYRFYAGLRCRTGVVVQHQLSAPFSSGWVGTWRRSLEVRRWSSLCACR